MLPLMRQRAMTLSFYAAMDDTVTLRPKWKTLTANDTHTRTHTHIQVKRSGGIISLRRATSYVPPSTGKKLELVNDRKKEAEPSSPLPLFLLPWFSSIPSLYPLFIIPSSTAASAGPNWWAEALSHIEVSVRSHTCIDAEGVIPPGLWCTKSASHNVATVARITPSWSN